MTQTQPSPRDTYTKGQREHLAQLRTLARRQDRLEREIAEAVHQGWLMRISCQDMGGALRPDLGRTGAVMHASRLRDLQRARARRVA